MIDTLLSQLHKVKQTGAGRWIACCPVHNDKSPSLSIKVTDDGKILIHCFAGCDVEEILANVDMSLSDLFPKTEAINANFSSNKRPFPAADILRCLGFEAQYVLITANSILQGETLSEEERTRLTLAYNRIQSAIDFGGLR